MTRRQRLLATFNGQPVDRPAVSFYEIGGWEMAPSDDEFTVWNDPSWRPLVQMALEETDVIRMVAPAWTGAEAGPLADLHSTRQWREGDSRFTRTTLRAPGRTLTSLARRDKDTQTVWVLEHLLKDVADLDAYLALPEEPAGRADVSDVLAQEKALGESGIVSIEAADPICHAASLFSMEDYTVMALTEPARFHRLLERLARVAWDRCGQVAALCPGRLWRIVGSEYASEPFLPPRLYHEYVVRYTGPMVGMIRRHGGFARVHSHGRLRGILGAIAEMGVDGLDPLEPPPQGDMQLREIRQAIGRQAVLMGNIEVADIENLPEGDFEAKVVTALREGTAGPGRGFVLHPSACPYGRTITSRTMANYQTMLRLARTWAG